MRTRNRWMPLLVMLVALAALLAAGCEKKTESSAAAMAGDKVLAKVNGTPITAGELQMWLQGPHGGTTDPDMLAKALDKRIDTELMYQKGLELGLDKDAAYQRMVHQLEIKLNVAKRAEMMRRVYSSQIINKINISDDQIKTYFDAHQDQIGTELQLASIPFRTTEDAQKALDEIKGGKTFDAVAEQFYPAKAKATAHNKKPWDMGQVAWQRIPTEWLDPLYGLKPGQVSGIISSDRAGIRIFKLIGRKAAAAKPELNKVSELIRRRLQEEKVKVAEADYMRKLQEGAKIERFDMK